METRLERLLCLQRNVHSTAWQNRGLDVVVVNEESQKVLVLEVACTFDSSIEEAFMTKVIKYPPLLNTILELVIGADYLSSYLAA